MEWLLGGMTQGGNGTMDRLSSDLLGLQGGWMRVSFSVRDASPRRVGSAFVFDPRQSQGRNFLRGVTNDGLSWLLQAVHHRDDAGGRFVRSGLGSRAAVA